MLTKAQIEQAKSTRNFNCIRSVLQSHERDKEILFVLKQLGKLPPEFDASLLMLLLHHPNEDIRLAAAKNLGKLKDASLLEPLSHMVRRETNTLVRREMVSAIGRMRTRRAIPILRELLQDVDAKVVLQAIRALLCFKDDKEVKDALLPLVEHPNELIQSVIQGTFNGSRPTVRKDTNAVKSPDSLKNLLVLGDVREALRHVPDESIHLTFTSPPYYNARDYTIYQSYEGYLNFLVEVFKEVHRITKEGRFFVLNTSPVIIPRMSRSHASTRYLIPFDIHPLITKIGFDFIEDIVWLKPDPSAKNRNGGFFQHRKPLGYKANSVVEYVIVYRKKTDKLIDWNMRQYDDETIEASKVRGDYEKTNVWKIAPSSDPVHPAIFPVELAARVIQFYSYKGDLVFDPFAGIGTVGQAALSLDRFFFLTEKEEAYAKRAFQLLNTENLFCDVQPRLLTLEEFRIQHPQGIQL